MAARSRRAGAAESKDPVRLAVGSLIKSRRSGVRDLTQVALSTKAGLPANAVGDLERGNRSIEGEELVRICIELDVPVLVFLEELRKSLARDLGRIEQRLLEERGKRSPDREPRSAEPIELEDPVYPEDPTFLVLAVQVARAGGKGLDTALQSVLRALNRTRRDEDPDRPPPPLPTPPAMPPAKKR
jgi:transcriptional regulator with XRE-family HTH domain